MAQNRVLVFLGAYHGAPFIEQQVETIRCQTTPCELIISDDAYSPDSETSQIEPGGAVVSLSHIAGPKQGFCSNFLSVFNLTDIDRYDYVAWSDQDDLWDTDHLARAVSVLARQHGPAACGSRTRLVDANGRAIGWSPQWPKPLGFSNALVQSVAGGNTLVMNQPCVAWVRACLQEQGQAVAQWISHDWALYLMLSLADYPLMWLSEPTVRYRQHGQNLIGTNYGLAARMRRFSRLRRGEYANWIHRQFEPLLRMVDWMSPENQNALIAFQQAAQTSGLSSLRALHQSGVYRQGVLDQRALEWAAFAGWLQSPKSRTP